MRHACLWLVCALLPAASVPRVFYSKSFPGSTPAYVAITIDKTGLGEYSEAADRQEPLKFQMKLGEVEEIFSLVEKLGQFTRPLEANLKVANMGKKTFRYEGGIERHEVQFNYSEDPDARTLANWFERIAESEQHLINLERAAKYDKLGLNKALLLLETSWDRKRLVAPGQFLPMLDRIAGNETYLHMARSRAAGLAENIRLAK